MSKFMEFFIEISVKAADAIAGLGKVEDSSEKAKRGLNDVGRSANNLSRDFTRSGVAMVRSSRLLDQVGQRAMLAGDSLAAAGGRMTAFATLPIVAGLVKAHNEATQARDAMSSVDGTIKSMGRTSEFTAAQLNKMATEQAKTTLFDNDDVMRDVTQNLLTFSKVNKDIFADAQQAILDYSAAAKVDLRAASTQVSKALQSADGALALSKTGAITKTDAKELKIIAEKNGHLAYQQALLKALNKQYKGQADLAAQADPAARSAKRLNDAWEKIGGVVDRVLEAAEPTITRFVDWLETLDKNTLTWAVGIAIAVAAIGPLLGILGGLVKGVGGIIRVLAFFKGTWGGFLISIGRAKAPMNGVLTVAQKFGSVLGRVAGFVIRAFKLIPGAIRIVGQVFMWLGRLMLANPIIAIIAAIAAAAYYLWSNWDWIGPKFWALWASISAAAGQAWEWIKTTFNAGIAWLSAIPGRMLAVGQAIMQGLVNGIASGAGWVRDKILGLASQVSGWFKSALGINSPSLVFAGFGGNLVEGLARGMDRTTKQAVDAAQRVADAVTAPGMQMAFNGATSGMRSGIGRVSATQRMLGQPVRSLASRPSVSHSNVTNEGSHINAPININGARDPQSVAREVGRELDRRDRRNSLRSTK